MRSIDSPRNARSQRTRDALLAATREILEHDGFAALSMAAVAERAGVTRRAVYLHFTSRSDLVSALFPYIAQQEGLAESTNRVWAAADSVEALREWVRHLARYHPKLMAVDRAIEQVRADDADARRHRDTVNEAQLGNCRRLAEWLHRENRLAHPWTVEEAADVLFGLICTELFGRWLETREWSTGDLDRNLWAICRAVLVRDQDGGV
ncbi:TetR/AcrR family transcriptional regulator [Phytoactinopolyspora halotolerans]|uniref:TetR/AcrR family transcriptional regulator n=1 Tax=Phytoactinopolyspora halotolerans TaxID=1981512 RepID=A0A6L9S632_9ACTN|nr:TetR/AcrR family transcriptional regulator [Phytoactinopolyspora halotolerans]NEE00905.1 TetR/AcrR family transcriptional regulator [Phytoactinopolyspora halotolerans]